MVDSGSHGDNDIAIVGMALRVPGARSVDQFWQNLCSGQSAIRPLSEEELLAEGVPRETFEDPRYVRVTADLQDMESFDADFFGLSPKEAAIMDPQHRQFLSCAWEALEDAAHPPERFDGTVGVFAGCGMGSYFAFNLLSNPELVRSVGLFLLRHTGNDKDFFSTRVSYNFNLTGPSVNIQTACSTSLVATHVACQSLLSGECDMALAGGCTIELPHRRGYHYTEGEILSPDGRCRAFDHKSEGTVFGSGVGVVVLRRLKEALEDGDFIHAVIKGSAVNNDGSGKAGYLAPSVDGQAAAVAEAIAVSGISADRIGYVECHGTGTRMGDPIEISALSQAFRQTTERTSFCGIGSVKTNIGHLDTAAGVVSLIKAALVVSHGQIPPSLNYEAPNPEIDFGSTPFLVNDRLRSFPANGHPRTAGVNSLGVGGTNAFMVIEEPPRAVVSSATTSAPLFCLAARNRKALDGQAARLASWLHEHPDAPLADVRFTLIEGRASAPFEMRRVFVARTASEAGSVLAENDARRVFTHRRRASAPKLVFMFPGGGAQYVGMGRGLYRAQAAFREVIDRGLAWLDAHTDRGHRAIFFGEGDAEVLASSLMRPSVQLPLVFLVEYALAQLLMNWGAKPAALIGHSMGENTAACLAGVFSFEDALGLVSLRGRLMDGVTQGGMLSVNLSVEGVKKRLGDHLDLASVNGPELTVVSGPNAELDALEAALREDEVQAQRVRIDIAAHSRMLDGILPAFRAYLTSIPLSAPKIPILSNRTHVWLTPEEAQDPEYWVRHLRHTIHFAEGIERLAKELEPVFLEVGPGRALSSFAKQNSKVDADAVLSCLRHQEDGIEDEDHWVSVLGRLWALGHPMPMDRLVKGPRPRRVRLPTYAFQEKRYWIEPGVGAQATDATKPALSRLRDLDDWFFQPVWRRRHRDLSEGDETWLVFLDELGLGRAMVEKLRAEGQVVIEVQAGDVYEKLSEHSYRVSPERGREGYDLLVRDLMASGKAPNRVVHLWLLSADESFRPGSSFFHRNLERGFYSLFFLAQAMGDEGLPRPVHLTVLSNGMQRVGNETVPYPEQATVLGPCLVMPREFPGITVSQVDMQLPAQQPRRSRFLPISPLPLLRPWRYFARASEEEWAPVVDRLLREVRTEPGNRQVALRGERRFERVFEPSRSEAKAPTDRASVWGVEGVFLITGALGGIGLSLAQYLARRRGTKLILVGRSALPERRTWAEWVEKHGDRDSTSRRIRAVLAMESAGAEVFVASADVTDVETMREIIKQAKLRFGRIDGIFHAAGLMRDNLIQAKTQSEVETVFAPKVYGTLVLDSLLKEIDPKFLVLFSSTSTLSAPPGQADYVAANAFLNAYAESFAGRPGPKVVAVDWGVWRDVGMAVDAATRLGYETVGQTGRDRPLLGIPLFDQEGAAEDGVRILEGTYRADALWMLDEHRTLEGRAVIPGTGYIEMTRQALVAVGETDAFQLSDLFFFRPLFVGDSENRQIRLRLRPDDSGYGVEIQSRTTMEDGRIAWERHAQARVSFPAKESVSDIDLPAIRNRLPQKRQAESGQALQAAQAVHLRFGPRWQVLRSLRLGQGEALAELALSEAYASELEAFSLHPALLDIATGYAMELIEGYGAEDERLWVPLSYERLTFHAPLCARVFSWVRLSPEGANDAASGFASFDVSISDASGRLLVEVKGFTVRRLESGQAFRAAEAPTSKEVEWDPMFRASGREGSPQEASFRALLDLGITPAEGVAALGRVLDGAHGPVAIVTSIAPEALIRHTEASVIEEQGDGTEFERPDLDSSYVEPRDDVERTLVGFWQELLGVKQVGVQDSFFDLGGHSLIAVRLFAKIKRTYRVEYPISVLFQAPTIERCAELIREALPQEGQASTSAATSPSMSTRRYKHLVAMHPGQPGQKMPFFLVAGMFGNVLNLRHLAQLAGTDRPFYGLQARGLFGDDRPHETFEEMARDYLEELRSVQPEGPYILGGFSGGGITAYEMAQQLRHDGQETALLVMLDTPLPFSEPLTSRDKLLMHWQNLRNKGAGYLAEWARDRYQWEAERLRRRGGEPDLLRPYDARSQEIEAAFYRALGRYRLLSYPGRMLLFRPPLHPAYVLGPGRMLNEHRGFLYEDNGWTPYVGGLEVHETPGDHDSMVLEPNVRALAARLRAALERLESLRPSKAAGQEVDSAA
jgi:acyl transferase domain-containing protein/thioesterase domain-containing protein/NADP-dependent 3-hydroxy acid dehydrogenase YdfG